MIEGGNAMAHDGVQGDILTMLRQLVACDPKEARRTFHSLLKGEQSILNNVLTSASRPGDGRLRQMVATACKTDENAKKMLEPWLRRWLDVESDEFTKAAIESALTSRSPPVTVRPSPPVSALQFVEAYRYVSDRLCHRVRNALTLPSAQIQHLEYLIRGVGDATLKQELAQILAGFQTGIIRISRNVEFDTGDDYLKWQAIYFISWLDSAAMEFTGRFGPARHAITCDPLVRRATVRATRFLLETIFGNLWSNSIQAAGPHCTINIQCALDSTRGMLDILFLDDGPGFPEAQLETAFQQAYSTKSVSRGRGLLEVAEAVSRLQGKVELTWRTSNEYRVRIQLPVENP